MLNPVTAHGSDATLLRMGVFVAIAVMMMIWEVYWPRRARVVIHSRLRRWPSNFGITAINALLTHLLIPLGAIGVAAVVQAQGWGLLSWLKLPPWAALLSAIVLLDLLIYAQHVVFHHVPLLWRLHRMHHADLDLAISSGGRFHTLEILLSAVVKMFGVAVIGASPTAVLCFEVLLNATAMFNHSNAYLPPAVDRVLRLLLITPDMHRVHHSVRRIEIDSNFGFNLPWWDRLFGTYQDQPQAGHAGMVIGLEQFHTVDDARLDRMWLIPFRKQ